MSKKIIEIVIRSTCAYALLLVLARLVGRKLISRITFFDFLIGVTLGSLAVRMALGSEESLLLSAISAIVITMLVIVTDYLNIRSLKLRILLDGKPVILINNGKMLEQNLKKMKITINELMMQLREKDVFNIEDVEYAIIESDGELTVLPKVNKKPITTGDLNISPQYTGLTSDIIIDGKIMHDNLKDTNYDENWLKKQLKSHNIKSVEDVFYAGLNAAGNLYISPKLKR